MALIKASKGDHGLRENARIFTPRAPSLPRRKVCCGRRVKLIQSQTCPAEAPRQKTSALASPLPKEKIKFPNEDTKRLSINQLNHTEDVKSHSHYTCTCPRVTLVSSNENSALGDYVKVQEHYGLFNGIFNVNLEFREHLTFFQFYKFPNFFLKLVPFSKRD